MTLTDKQVISNHIQIVSLYAPPKSFIELRAFSDKARDGQSASFWLPSKTETDHIEKATAWAEAQAQLGRGVFISYNARRHQQGTKSNVQEMTACYVDLDLEKRGVTREQAMTFINDAPVRPDLVVDSGRGLHIIHFFTPVMDKGRWQGLQTALADYYEPVAADMSLRTDESRVLRLAGTPNQKGDAPRQTLIRQFRPVDTAAEFTGLAEAFNASIDGKRELQVERDTKLVDRITEGGERGTEYEGRNHFLFSRGCSLRDEGYSRSEIGALLEVMNEARCAPPLTSIELEGIIDRVSKYAPRYELQQLTDENVSALGKTHGELMDIIFPSIEPVVFGLYAGELGMIQSRPNVGKTTLMLNVAQAAAVGRAYAPMLDESAPKRVMYMDFENRESFLQRDVCRMAERNFDSFERASINENIMYVADAQFGGLPLNLSNKQCMDAVVKLALMHAPEIIIIDTLAAAFSLANENDNSEMQRVVITPLQRLARTTNATVLLVHHIGKQGDGSEQSKLYRGRGASSLAGAVRLILDLDHLKDADRNILKGYVLLNCAKVKGAAFEDAVFCLDFERRWFDPSDEPAPSASASKFERIIELIDRPMSRADLIDACRRAVIEVSEKTIERTMKLAVESGLLIKTGKTFTPTILLLERTGKTGEAEVVHDDGIIAHIVTDFSAKDGTGTVETWLEEI